MFEQYLSSVLTAPPRDVRLLPGLSYANAIRLNDVVWAAFTTIFAMAAITLIGTIGDTVYTYRTTKVISAEVVSVVGAPEYQAPTRRVVYEFVTDKNVRFRGQFSVNAADEYYGIPSGGNVPIEYVVDDPAQNRLDLDYHDSVAHQILFKLFFPALILISASLAAWSIVPLMLSAARARRCFRSGDITTASVTFIRSKGVQRGEGLSIVFVSFVDVGGAQIDACVECRNSWLMGLLHPGDTVHIAYDRKKPTVVALLDSYVR